MSLKRAEVGYFDDEDTGEPSTGRPRLSVSDTEAGILSGLGAGRTCLEIGTGLGVSTRALAWGAELVVTHDIDVWVWEHVWPSLQDEGVHVADERDGLVSMTFDLVFIDADHSTTAVLEDIAFARRLGSPLIVCHDARYPNVDQAIPKEWLRVWTEHGLAIGR